MPSSYIGVEPRTPPIEMWEYKVIQDARPHEDKLNELGKQGWDLVTVDNQSGSFPNWYFKRRLYNVVDQQQGP